MAQVLTHGLLLDGQLNALYGLFPRWICEINPTSSGNVPFGKKVKPFLYYEDSTQLTPTFSMTLKARDLVFGDEIQL